MRTWFPLVTSIGLAALSACSADSEEPSEAPSSTADAPRSESDIELTRDDITNGPDCYKMCLDTQKECMKTCKTDKCRAGCRSSKNLCLSMCDSAFPGPL